ncbi:MAG: RNA-binding cell elongation regulator Jag/EloR [Enterococcus sp.]
MPIYEGLTIEDAIQSGLASLALKKEDAVIEVLAEGKKGFLGMGRKNAQVSIEAIVVEKIEPLVSEPLVKEKELKVDQQSATKEQLRADEQLVLDDETAIRQLASYLTNITTELGAPAVVKITREANLIVLNLESQKQGVLIGKHGRMLNALQYLAQVFIHRVAKNKLSVMINVADYREKRQVILERLATKTADKVKRTQRAVFLEPMPAFERKQIHAALSKDEKIKTYSEGDEPYRYLVVEPIRKY